VVPASWEEEAEVEAEAKVRAEPEIRMDVSAADEAETVALVSEESANPPSPPNSLPALHPQSPCVDAEVVMLRAQLKRSEQACREFEEKHLCAICLVEERNCWFVPCGHQVCRFPVFVVFLALFASHSLLTRKFIDTPKFNQACQNCADNLPKQLCHICRAPIHAKQAI
jgi:hypothetical protein